MEASQAFDEATQGGSDAPDPFGESGMGDFQQDDPFNEGEAPLVNREGEPVEGAQDFAPSSATPDGPTQVEPPDPSQATPADPANGGSGDGEPDPTGAAESAAASDPAGTDSGAQDSSSTPSAASEPAKAKGDTRRAYKLLVPEGRGKYAEVAWYEKGGKVVGKGTNGAEKRDVILAANNSEALAHGFGVLGEPAEGCSLIAVPTSHFKVRSIVAKAPPIKTRLSIS